MYDKENKSDNQDQSALHSQKNIHIHVCSRKIIDDQEANVDEEFELKPIN